MTVVWILGALALAAYVVVATMMWRRAAWFFADKARYEPDERFTPFEIVWGLAVGAVFAAIWPLTLAVWLVSTRGIAFLGRRFLLPPSEIREQQDAKAAAAQEHRIAELERQVEIR